MWDNGVVHYLVAQVGFKWMVQHILFRLDFSWAFALLFPPPFHFLINQSMSSVARTNAVYLYTNCFFFAFLYGWIPQQVIPPNPTDKWSMYCQFSRIMYCQFSRIRTHALLCALIKSLESSQLTLDSGIENNSQFREKWEEDSTEATFPSNEMHSNQKKIDSKHPTLPLISHHHMKSRKI